MEYTLVVRAEGSKQDIDAICQIFEKEQTAIISELDAEKFPQCTLSLSDVERLSDTVFGFRTADRGGISPIVFGLMNKFPQLYVAYMAYRQDGIEGRFVYDKEERFFKAGYAVHAYSEIDAEDEKQAAEVHELVKQLDPDYDLVCHTMEELLQEIGKRYGRYLTEEEWKAKGISFEEIKQDEITRKA